MTRPDMLAGLSRVAVAYIAAVYAVARWWAGRRVWRG